MTYRIHDWTDKRKYPRDPSNKAPKEFISLRMNPKKSEIRAVIRHWEFLRRHKQYQENWERGHDELFMLYKIGSRPGPDPRDDFPLNLLFIYELTKDNLVRPTTINLRQSWPENMKRLRSEYALFRASISPPELLALALSQKPIQKPTSTRIRQLSDEKCSNLLRVLDAFADGKTPTEISKKLNTSHSAGTISRWRESALDLQAELTGLPRMSKEELMNR